MSSVTLKNIPDDLHQSLKTAANVNGRSLNKEIIKRLEISLENQQTSPSATLERAQAVREKLGVYLTGKDLAALKNEGRV